jgi:U2-associated protein SR140
MGCIVLQSKPLDQQKLSQYTATTVKKSKREKEAEVAEAKRKAEEEQAAKVRQLWNKK